MDVNNEKDITISTRKGFLTDTYFKDCWKDVEEAGVYGVRLPWKYDYPGQMKEIITSEIYGVEKSVEVETCKWSYKILLDVHNFAAEDLKITLTERTIQIIGKHEEKSLDGIGIVSRSFTRKFIVPPDMMMDMLECNLSSDGILHMTAPRELQVNKEQENEDENDREQTGRRNSLKDTIKDSFDSLMSWVKPTTVMEGIVYSVPEQSDEFKPNFATREDFDVVPFWENDKSKFGNKSDSKIFKIAIDVKGFEPNDLTVHTTEHYVHVEGKHKEMADKHGTVSRHFIKKYWLPRDVHAKDVTGQLTGGVLEIIAPKIDRAHDRRNSDIVSRVDISTIHASGQPLLKTTDVVLDPPQAQNDELISKLPIAG